MSMRPETMLTFESGGLRLEAARRDGDGALSAVVLHPHPQYGGDMQNHVVITLCKVFAAAGATTLRFNFRGAGHSEGAFDHGRGEADDARAAVAFLRRERGERPLVLAGYSFGAAVAAAVVVDVAPAALVLVSPPVGFAPLPAIPEGVPALIVAGDRDEAAPARALRDLASANVKTAIVNGVDHGWWQGLDSLVVQVGEFVSSLRLVR